MKDTFNKKLLTLYRRQWFRTVVHYFAKPAQPKKWAFILGCYNSGTTLLDYILSCHKEISNLPTEGVDLTGELSAPEDFGWPRLWYKCRKDIESNFNDKRIDPDIVKKDWGFWFDRNSNVFVEKSIANSLRISWLNENFEQPLFIWIIRNGYCVAEGIRRRSAYARRTPKAYRGKGYPIEWCARQWVKTNQLIENESKGMDNVIRIFYEDFVADPSRVLRYIYKYLPIRDKQTPELGKFTFHGSSCNIKDMNVHSMKNISSADIHNINHVAKEWLEYFGYPVIYQEFK